MAAWKTFDWLFWEAGSFAASLNNLAATAYKAAHSQLEADHNKRVKELEEELQKAEDEDSHRDASQFLAYEEEQWLDQNRALATMAFALLAAMLLSFLKTIKTYFDKTVPPKSKYGKSGDGELDRRVAEYQDRFGIDLDAISEMSTVREVILARNCCIHLDASPDAEYAARTKQRLLDERGMINITSEQFDMVVKDL